MKESFNSTFYAVAATVVPVLYLALAVQGPMHKDLLARALAAARTRPGEQLPRTVAAVVVSQAWLVGAYAIVAGLASEIIALVALYKQSDNLLMRLFAIQAVVALTVVAGAGPAWEYTKVAFRLPLQRGTATDKPKVDPPRSSAPQS